MRPRDVLSDNLRERTTIRSQPLYALTIEIYAKVKGTDSPPTLSNRVLILLKLRFVSNASFPCERHLLSNVSIECQITGMSQRPIDVNGYDYLL